MFNYYHNDSKWHMSNMHSVHWSRIKSVWIWRMKKKYHVFDDKSDDICNNKYYKEYFIVVVIVVDKRRQNTVCKQLRKLTRLLLIRCKITEFFLFRFQFKCTQFRSFFFLFSALNPIMDYDYHEKWVVDNEIMF